MDWNSLATQNYILAASALVAFGILVATLVATLGELKSLHKAVGSQAYSSITSDLHALDKLFIECPSFEQLLDNESPAGSDKIRQKWLVFWHLNLYENAHFQKKEGVIPEKLWEGWEKEIKRAFEHRGFKKQYYDEDLKKYYNKDFQEFIEKLPKSNQ